MSVMNTHHQRVVLLRSGLDSFWHRLRDAFDLEDDAQWKRLAMFALREDAGWPLSQIALAFGHGTRHVRRCVARAREEVEGIADFGLRVSD